MDAYIPNPDINDNELDDVCINKIEELKLQVDNAVKNENYDHAKVLDELIKRIRLLGIKIKNLTDIKVRAIEISDYDTAKQMKNEIERIREIINEVADVQEGQQVVYYDQRNINPLFKEEEAPPQNENNFNYENTNTNVILTKRDEIRQEMENKKKIIKENKKQAEENLKREKNDRIDTHERQITKKYDDQEEVEEEIRVKNY